MKVTIKSTLQPWATVIEIDGRPVEKVVCVSYRHAAGGLPHVTLEILPDEIEIEGEAEVEFINRT